MRFEVKVGMEIALEPRGNLFHKTFDQRTLPELELHPYNGTIEHAEITKIARKYFYAKKKVVVDGRVDYRGEVKISLESFCSVEEDNSAYYVAWESESTFQRAYECAEMKRVMRRMLERDYVAYSPLDSQKNLIQDANLRAMYQAMLGHTEREFSIDTPYGEIYVHAKTEVDDPQNFPGVYVDLRKKGKGDILLSATEYETTFNCIQTCIYNTAENGESDDPVEVYTHITHEDLGEEGE